MKSQSVRLTNGETIDNVVEVQFSQDGQAVLQLDVTDHAIRFGIEELLKFYKGKIDHIYVWHRCNGELCHTKVYGGESDLFDSQLREIAKEIEIAYPAIVAEESERCEHTGMTRDELESICGTDSQPAQITAIDREIKCGCCTLTALFNDGSTRALFSYYIDELTFSDADLIGLTAAEAHNLRAHRDVEYLRS